MKIQSEVLLQAVFQSNPIAIVIATVEEGVILDVNDSFVRAMGFTRKDVIGKTTSELGFWKTNEQRLAFIDALKSQRIVQDIQVNLACQIR